MACCRTVDSLDQELKFKVTEKHEKDVLGQVVVRLDELGNHNTSSPHKVPLRPHKKSPTPHGLLIFEAWITAKKVDNAPSKSSSMESLKSIKSLGFSSGLKKLKDRMTISSKSSDSKNKKNSSESLFALKTRNAVSCQDVTRESPFYIPADRRSLHSDVVDSFDALDSMSEFSDDYQKRNSLNLAKVSEFICPKPEVTSISPKSGSETGGTVLTIRGSNLGQNQEDVVVLNICGSDVLDTLEYISPWKLQCKTVPWKPCVGGISIETLSGGRGLSLVEFTFSEVEKPKTLTSDKTSLHSAPEDADDNTETYASRYEDASDSNGIGFAISYSDITPGENSFSADVLKVSPNSWISPSSEISDEQHEESANLRLSTSEEMSLDSGSRTSPSLKEKDLTEGMVSRTSSKTESESGYSDSVSGEVTKHEIKGSTKLHAEPEGNDIVKTEGHSKEENGQKQSVQINIVPASLDAELGPDKRSVGLNGAATKQPPPVGEIQPMRMEDSIPSSDTSSSLAPRKPPRQYPEKHIYGRNSINEMTQLSSRQTVIIQVGLGNYSSRYRFCIIIITTTTASPLPQPPLDLRVGAKNPLPCCDVLHRYNHYLLVPTSLPVSTSNIIHHSRLTVDLPDSLDLHPLILF